MIPVPSATIIAIVVAGVTGFAAGYTWEHRASKPEIAAIRADIARREAAAAEESRRRIETAQKAADQAIAARDARIADLDATTRRLRHDLSTATTGRPCLSSAARGLLQRSPAFGIRLPEATGGAFPAHAGIDLRAITSLPLFFMPSPRRRGSTWLDSLTSPGCPESV
jgi:hypothetical protein